MLSDDAKRELSVQDMYGNTPLHYFALRGGAFFSYLEELGADGNRIINNGEQSARAETYRMFVLFVCCALALVSHVPRFTDQVLDFLLTEHLLPHGGQKTVSFKELSIEKKNRFRMSLEKRRII